MITKYHKIKYFTKNKIEKGIWNEKHRRIMLVKMFFRILHFQILFCFWFCCFILFLSLLFMKAFLSISETSFFIFIGESDDTTGKHCFVFPLILTEKHLLTFRRSRSFPASHPLYNNQVTLKDKSVVGR